MRRSSIFKGLFRRDKTELTQGGVMSDRIDQVSSDWVRGGRDPLISPAGLPTATRLPRPSSTWKAIRDGGGGRSRALSPDTPS